MQTLIQTIRRLRHGSLKRFEPVWRILGRGYRRVQERLGARLRAKTRIGPYGPFLLNGRFTFSDFENWGDQHNAGFRETIETCRGRNCFFDVGAHIGLVALPAATVLAPGGKAYAFEPARVNRSLLLEHKSFNGLDNIEVIDLLVGDEDRDDVPFFEMDSASGINSVVVKKSWDAFQETRKRQISLDRFCQREGLHPEVIKIDVEGFENAVIRGMTRLLREVRPIVFLSVHPSLIERLGESVEGLVDFIHDAGYQIFQPETQTEVKQLQLRNAEYRLAPREGPGKEQ